MSTFGPLLKHLWNERLRGLVAGTCPDSCYLVTSAVRQVLGYRTTPVGAR